MVCSLVTVFYSLCFHCVWAICIFGQQEVGLTPVRSRCTANGTDIPACVCFSSVGSALIFPSPTRLFELFCVGEGRGPHVAIAPSWADTVLEHDGCQGISRIICIRLCRRRLSRFGHAGSIFSPLLPIWKHARIAFRIPRFFFFELLQTRRHFAYCRYAVAPVCAFSVWLFICNMPRVLWCGADERHRLS